jgi:hypothetical protein
MTRLRILISTGLALGSILLVGAPRAALAQMPDARAMSGRPLPSPDVPPGSLSVRVARGGFENSIEKQLVEVFVDGQPVSSVTTGEDGRAIVSGLRLGNSVRVATTVGNERLESQPIPIGSTGMMVALVAVGEVDPAAAAAASAPAVPGTVSLGPESRVIVELAENGLTVFYVLDIINAASTPVDIGGPLIVDFPREARGAGLLQDSTPQASVNGPRLIVTGPFAPGSTLAQVAYELPYRGPTARLEQTWPADLAQLTLLVEQRGMLEIASPQVTARNMVMNEGQPLIFASGPGMASGQTLEVDFSGLPHHPAWPQWTALSLAMALMAWGVWGAATAPRRRS